jgi:hypothetical protein
METDMKKRRWRGRLLKPVKPEGADDAYWSCGRKLRYKKRVNAERQLKRIKRR